MLGMVVMGCSTDPSTFEGQWTGEVSPDATRTYRMIITFDGPQKMIVDNRIELANDQSPGGRMESPGPVCEYRYERTEVASDQGSLVLTMTSLQVEGQDRALSDADRAPVTWEYRITGSGLMEITKPAPGGKRTYALHKD